MVMGANSFCNARPSTGLRATLSLSMGREATSAFARARANRRSFQIGARINGHGCDLLLQCSPFDGAQGDPELVDGSRGDFRLRPGSGEPPELSDRSAYKWSWVRPPSAMLALRRGSGRP